MRTNPTPESELERELSSVLDEGTYDCLVKTATEKTSSAGNEMIELVLEVYNGTSSRQVYDWLVASDHAFPKRKIRHFCRACNLMDAYDNDSLDAEQCEGCSCKVELVVEKDDYGLKNRVRDYVGEEAPTAKPIAPRPPRMQPMPEDGEMPF